MASVSARTATRFRFFQGAIIAVLLLLGIPNAFGQAADKKDQSYSTEKLEQLVAPIALHPDALMTQMLMASTYPLEVVQAARWLEENPKVTGDPLEAAMGKQSWDPSVKSLTAFPQALEMMNKDLAWTQELGDAFLAQQEDVLSAVQRLRAKADEAGNLKSTKEQTVEKQIVTTESGQKETVIIVQPAEPTVIYVPAYNPTVVYGIWPYTAYPPYYYRPPGYVARGAFWFTAGVVTGRALWGSTNWGRGTVNINVNNYNRYSRTNVTNNQWKHNSAHRKGVPYSNRNVAQRNGQGNRNAKSREQYRGRANAGRQELKRSGGSGQRSNTTNRSGQKSGQRSGNRSTNRSSQRPDAYRGNGSGQQTRKQSSRGRSSRQSSGSRGGGRRGGGRKR